MDSGYEVRPFEIESADEKQLNAWHHLKSSYHKELYPDDEEVTLEIYLEDARAIRKLQDSLNWAAWKDDGTMAAYCVVHASKLYPGREHGIMSILVHRNERRRGLATALLPYVLKGSASLGKERLRCFSSSGCPEGSMFLENIEAEKVNESHVNQLNISDVDWKTIDRWLGFPDTGEIDLAMEVLEGPYPDRRLQDIADLHQAILDRDRETNKDLEPIVFTPEMVRKWEEAVMCSDKERVAVLAVDRANGRMVGLTDVLWLRSRPAVLSQGMTGVLPDYRCRGIGRRLKAEMMNRISSHNPRARVIRSVNADFRGAIRKINSELGFRHLISNYKWQTDTSAIEDHLRKRTG